MRLLALSFLLASASQAWALRVCLVNAGLNLDWKLNSAAEISAFLDQSPHGRLDSIDVADVKVELEDEFCLAEALNLLKKFAVTPTSVRAVIGGQSCNPSPDGKDFLGTTLAFDIQGESTVVYGLVPYTDKRKGLITCKIKNSVRFKSPSSGMSVNF